MANSVLETLDIDDEINEVKLLISGYRSINKFTVLVEGIDDVIVYEKFFSKGTVEVHQTSGCFKLLELVSKLDAEHLEDYFIGIKDADYDVLNHVTNPYSNLFLTDKHDLETMMMSEKILENIMKVYLRYEDMKKDGKVIEPNIILSDAFRLLRPISFIRWYNDKKNIKISFGTLKLSTLMKSDNSLGVACCLSFFMRLNENSSIELTEEDIKSFVSEVSENIDDMMLIRGHDLCDMVSLLIQAHPYYCQKAKVNADKIESSLRLSYGIDDFKQTQLYMDLSKWFDAHGYKGLMIC